MTQSSFEHRIHELDLILDDVTPIGYETGTAMVPPTMPPKLPYSISHSSNMTTMKTTTTSTHDQLGYTLDDDFELDFNPPHFTNTFPESNSISPSNSMASNMASHQQDAGTLISDDSMNHSERHNDSFGSGFLSAPIGDDYTSDSSFLQEILEPRPIEPSRVTVVPQVELKEILRDNMASPSSTPISLQHQHHQDPFVGCDQSSTAKENLLDIFRPLFFHGSSSYNLLNDDLIHITDNNNVNMKSEGHPFSSETMTAQNCPTSDLDCPNQPSTSTEPTSPSSNPRKATAAQRFETSFQCKMSQPRYKRRKLISFLRQSLTRPHQNDASDQQQEQAPEQEAQKDAAPASTNESKKIRHHQEAQWDTRYNELVEYRERFGHCSVPHTHTENLPLAQWVKRQRYQYKLRLEGKHCTMTTKRQQMLQDIGFCWDSHTALWEERFSELLQYKKAKGHCVVPARYAGNLPLAVWVKCQRRQYKLLMEGRPSNMSDTRIRRLNGVGFVWNPRDKRARQAAQQTSA